MKRLFLLLCMAALLSAMEVEIQDAGMGRYSYKVKELAASNATLQIILMKEGTQYYFEKVDNFNGLYRGTITSVAPGNYVLRVIDTTTGDSLDQPLTVASQAAAQAAVNANATSAQAAYVEQKTSIPAEQIFPGLPYIIVGLFVIIVLIFFFANPLKKKK